MKFFVINIVKWVKRSCFKELFFKRDIIINFYSKNVFENLNVIECCHILYLSFLKQRNLKFCNLSKIFDMDRGYIILFSIFYVIP